MNSNQKLAAAVTVGLLVLLTGAYSLYAVERNGESGAIVALNDTDAAITPLEATSRPGKTSQTSRTNGTNGTNGTNVAASPSVARALPSTTMMMMVPAGTTVNVKIQTQVSSRDAKVGDRVTGATIGDVIVNGQTVIPSGSTVVGEVTSVRPASETKAAAVLKFAFTRIADHAAHLAMILPDLEARARAANHAVDAGLIVGGAAAGAVIGNQTRSRSGSEIGAVVGGVAGGIAAANIGANVQLKAGETAKLRFTEDLNL